MTDQMNERMIKTKWKGRKEGRKKDEHRSIHSAAHLGLREEGRVLHLHPLRVDLGWLRVKLTANLVLAGAWDVLHTGWETHTARPGHVDQATSSSFIQFVIAVDISYVCLVPLQPPLPPPPPPPHTHTHTRTDLASFILSKLVAVDISSLCLVPPVRI